MNKAEVFSYSKTENHFYLFVKGVSTRRGLSVFSSHLSVSIVCFGATNYAGYGWATEENLPKLLDIQAICRFFDEYSDLGLFDFEIHVEGGDKLMSNDDLVCHFFFRDKKDLVTAIQVLAPIWHEKIINLLFQNPDMYLTCDGQGHIQISESFNQALAGR